MTDIERFKEMIEAAGLTYSTSTDLFLPSLESVVLENMQTSDEDDPVAVDVVFVFSKPAGDLRGVTVRKERVR